MNWWFVVSAALAIWVCAAANPPVSAASAAETAPIPASVQPGDYRIGIKDTLEIDVYDLPNISQTVVVDNMGSIALPMIGQIPASGRTPNELSREIAAALNARYTKDAIVTVSVRDAASKKITVDGSVAQPGMYEITPGTTLSQAVALAKGPDQVADIHHVAIIRGQGQARTTSVYDLEDIRDGKTVDPSVQADDTIVVDTSGSRKFVRDYGSVISILGWMHP